MKKIIIMFAVAFFATQIIQGQGTTYISNLGYISTGSSSVGSDAWFAADFFTGTNAGGYALNSVQLATTDASGNPSGFTVMLYSSISGFATFPGSNLGTLNGSLNPVSSGTYTYTPASSLALSPSTVYFIVLTAGTAIANGAYGWSVTSTPSPGFNSYHWGGEVHFADSSNGSSWNYVSGTYGQFALNATAVPEPSPSWLILLGSGVFIYARRTFHR